MTCHKFPLLNFSPEQAHSITNLLLPALKATLDTALSMRFGPPPQYNQSASPPKQAVKQEQE